MNEKKSNKQKINSLIESFFIIAGLSILISTLLAGLYFNKYDEQEKAKTNAQKIHSVLSQLIIPSLIISDLSEVKRLLFMASGNEETFLVIDNDGNVIMPDYEKKEISTFLFKSYQTVDDCKNLAATYRYIADKKYLINCSILKNSDVLSNEKNAGVLLSFTNYKLFTFSSVIFYFVGILLVLFLLLIFLFRKMLYWKLLQPLATLKNSISGIPMIYEIPEKHIDEIYNAPAEFVEIKDAFDSLLLSLKEEYNRRVEAEKMKALIDLSAGVAHDIRSPLIALDIIIKDIQSIPEEQRIVIRNAANRISDIANNLLTQYKQKFNSESGDRISYIKSELISDLLMSLTSEKRMQYRNDATKLIINIEENAYGKFATISTSAFNRVLSNIIDNSIQASAEQVNIELRMINIERKQPKLLLTIQDDGCGMELETLQKIMNGESISSKKKGNGLGMLQAIKTVKKEWCGEFNIKSLLNVGTTVEILLPESTSPKWFLPKIIVNSNEKILILDDDESIHQVWKKRFNEIDSGFQFINHYNPQDLLNYDENILSSINLFLIDYEYIGCTITGLNLIEELGIADRSYLVTSRHEENDVRERCEEIGLKIIPKAFAVYIPIIISKKNIKSANLIFIDDDLAITDAWRLHGLMKGKTVATYNSIRAFQSEVGQYDLDTPIYIDSEFNDKIKGQDYAKELFDIGFKVIYLATAHSSNNFHNMYWIKKIVGKEPPF